MNLKFLKIKKIVKMKIKIYFKNKLILLNKKKFKMISKWFKKIVKYLCLKNNIKKLFKLTVIFF